MCSSEEAPELFRCLRCGDCCKGYGGTAVDEGDIAAIARHLNLSPGEVRDRFCLPAGKGHLLGQREDGYCVFWDGLCRIHPVKPRMCRRWPFIEGLLRDPGNWRVMASVCPGMRADAPLAHVLRFTAARLAAERREALASPSASSEP